MLAIQDSASRNKSIEKGGKIGFLSFDLSNHSRPKFPHLRLERSYRFSLCSSFELQAARWDYAAVLSYFLAKVCL